MIPAHLAKPKSNVPLRLAVPQEPIQQQPLTSTAPLIKAVVSHCPFDLVIEQHTPLVKMSRQQLIGWQRDLLDKLLEDPDSSVVIPFRGVENLRMWASTHGYKIATRIEKKDIIYKNGTFRVWCLSKEERK